MPKTKEEKAEYNRKYYLKHKEERKKYLLNHKEEKAKYAKEYQKNNKEKVSAIQKRYYEKHKEERIEYIREYQKNNKEKKFNYQKEYRKTPNGIKSQMISNWKQRGIKSDNYDMLYNNYLSETHCDLCRVEFGKMGDGTGTFKCCDHDHDTGLFRNFLCNICNIRRG